MVKIVRLAQVATVVAAAGFAGIGAMAAALAADMPVKAPPPVAPPPTATGYVELYGGWAEIRSAVSFCLNNGTCGSGSDTVDGWVLGGAGRATYWWASNASVQLDAQAEGTSYKAIPGLVARNVSSHGYLIGGHANWRNPQSGLLGVFGGAGDATNFGTNDPVRHWLVGLEGQLYWGMLTLYGQVGYTSTIGSINVALDGINAWFVRGTARVYPTPNFRLEGTVLYADGDYDLTGGFGGISQSFQTWLWRAKGEYKFAASPFSLFATYEGSRSTFDFTGSGTILTSTRRIADHRVMGGVRLYLGENTLRWNDNNGTTLDIIAPFNAPSFIYTGSRPIL